VGGLAVSRVLAQVGAASVRGFGVTALVGFALVSAADGYARSWMAGAAAMRQRHANLLRARLCILDSKHASDACLRLSSPFTSADSIRWLAPLLERDRLGPFRDRP